MAEIADFDVWCDRAQDRASARPPVPAAPWFRFLRGSTEHERPVRGR